MGIYIKRIAAALVVAVAAFAVNAPMTLTAEAAAGGCNDPSHSGYVELTSDNTGLIDGTLSGNYRLARNITLTDEITISNEVTICLNGKEIKAATDKRVFKVAEDASLTICDCVGTGKITGGDVGNDHGGGVYVDKGTFVLNGGTITGNRATEGAGVYVGEEKSKFEMTGGTISGNSAIHQGGGVYVHNDGKFTMSGGIISGNSVTEKADTTYGGGGVYTAGIFTMSGTGKISDNTSNHFGGGVVVSGSNAQFILINGTISGNKSGTYGGGVHVSSSGTVNMRGGSISGNETEIGRGGGGVSVSGGTFTMENGSISGNTSSYGGGLYLTAGSFTMTGGAISGNEASLGSCVYMDTDFDHNNPGGTLTLNGKVTITSNTSSNVYLRSTKTITIGSNFSVTEPIGIHPENPLDDCQHTVPAATFDTGVTPADISDKFKADREQESVVYKNNEIELIGPHSYDSENWGKNADEHWHICTNCGSEVEKAAHRWDNGTIIRQPTAAAAGEKKYVCLDCKHEKYEPIPYRAPSTGGGNRAPEKAEDNSVMPVSTNPPTGIELAIAPAALAFVGLGVALTRKRR